MKGMDMYLEFRLHLIINRYFLPCLLLLGTVGNIMILVVLSRPRNFKYSTARFMLALAISDLITLWLAIPNTWIESMYGFNMRAVSEVLCKLLTALSIFAGQISVLFIVILNIERLIAIMSPLKYKTYCTTRNVNNVIRAIPFVVLIISGHTIHGTSIDENGKCSRNENLYNEWTWWIWLIINIAISVFVSFSIVLVTNICIFTKLGKNNCRRLKNNHARIISVEGHVNKEKMLKISFTLSLVTISFMICYIPMGIFLMTHGGEKLEHGNSYEDAKIILFFTASSTCSLINNALNFFIYFLRGSKFRKEVGAIFCKKIKN